MNITRCIENYCCSYSILVAALIMTLTFPLGVGQYFGARVDTHHQIEHLFSNFSWMSSNLSTFETNIIRQWTVDGKYPLLSLCGFCFYMVGI